MPQNDIPRDLLLKRIIKLTEKELEQRAHALETSKNKRPQEVREYNKKRTDLLKLRLALQQESWCTFCDKIFPDKDISLLFVEGVQQDLIRNKRKRIRELHQVCFKCKQHALAGNNPREDYERSPDDLRRVCAFPAEVWEGEYYAVKFGLLTRIPDGYHKVDISGALVERIALERGLPPGMILLRPGPVRGFVPYLTKQQQVRGERTLLIIYMRVKDPNIL